MTAVDPDAPRRDLQEAKRRVHRHPNEDCRPGMVRGHLYPCMVFAERQAAATRTAR